MTPRFSSSENVRAKTLVFSLYALEKNDYSTLPELGDCCLTEAQIVLYPFRALRPIEKADENFPGLAVSVLCTRGYDLVWILAVDDFSALPEIHRFAPVTNLHVQ